MVRDIRLAFRLIARQPLMAVTAILALTVGIALANIGFATMEALLFSRLPFDQGDRFVRLSAVSQLEREPVILTAEGYGRLGGMADTLEHVGAVTGGRETTELPSGSIEEVAIAGITPSSVRYMAPVAIRGRLLLPADAEPGSAPVALIGETFWRRSMQASESAVGASLTIRGVSRTIVGIASESFSFPSKAAVWMPLDERFRDGNALPENGARLFGVMAPDVTLEALASRLEAIGPHLTAALVPRTPELLDPRTPGPRRAQIVATAFTDLGEMAPLLSSAIVIVMLTVLMVIAANVGNLVLARSLARAHEFALRAALGASRGRLVGQVLTEVLALGFVSAVLGSVAAGAVLRRFNAMDEIPAWVDFTGGPFTFVAVAGATLLATAVAGAWPALRATRRDLLGGLQGAGGRNSDVTFGRVAGVMVVAQIAVSVVMLHGALVVSQAFRNYTNAPLDLPRNVLATRFLRTNTDISVAEAERIAAGLPGVVAVGAATSLPRHSPQTQMVEVEPRPGERALPARPAPSAAVSPTYFGALGKTASAGRVFTVTDTIPSASAVAIVNEPFVQAMFGGGAPIGRRFRVVEGNTPGPWLDVIGVVPDLGLSIGDPNLGAGFYVPLTPAIDVAYLAMRVNGEPLAYAEPLRRALRERDPWVERFSAERLEDVNLDDRQFFASFSSALTGIGGLTLVVALVGVYSMMSLVISRRTREIGIRVALGATPSLVIRAVASRAAVQVLGGGAVGAALALLSLQGRSILVSRMGDGGTWTLPLVIGFLVAAGLAATWVPLRRALRIRPQEALKAE